MHPGIGEAALCEGWQGREGAVKLAGVWERVQVRGAWRQQEGESMAAKTTQGLLEV
jgi:hypothetical protein